MTETFQQLTIATVRHIPGDAIEITFDIPASSANLFVFKPGQHVAVRAVIDGIVQRRTYSICSRSNGPLRIGIKHQPAGVFSSWANSHLKAGDSLDVAPPQGRFTLPAPTGAPRNLLMLAGGSGITPILGMTLEALEGDPASRVTLVYGTRSLRSSMFLEELEDLKDRNPARFDMINILSGPGEAETELLQGRLTGDKLKALAGRRIDLASVEHAFLCGPNSFIKESRTALFELGLAREAVHHEFFAGRSGAMVPVAPPQSTDPIPVLPTGTISAIAILDGQRHKFSLARGQHVLEAALQAGIKAPYSCTGGMCSTCRARVVEGAVAMTVNYSLEDWELRRGFVLTCQAVATSETLVIDYDAM